MAQSAPQTPQDRSQHADQATVLFVDDEERILRSLKMLFRGQYRVLTATGGEQALDIVRSEHVHVIVSDQRMPGMLGAALLARVKVLSPATMRLLLTGYSDLTATIDSVNQGEIFRYIQKPWLANDIRAVVAEAADIALAQAEANVPGPAAGDANRPAAAPADGLPEGRDVVVLDEDADTAATVRAALGAAHRVHAARTLDEALALLGRLEVAVLVTELRAAGEDLSAALALLKQHNPAMPAIVLTSFQDTHSLVDLINHGQIYRFLPKPARKGLLELSLNAALDQYESLRSSATLQRRHRVRQREDDDSRALAQRVMGYLKRLRQRPSASPEGAAS